MCRYIHEQGQGFKKKLEGRKSKNIFRNFRRLLHLQEYHLAQVLIDTLFINYSGFIYHVQDVAVPLYGKLSHVLSKPYYKVYPLTALHICYLHLGTNLLYHNKYLILQPSSAITRTSENKMQYFFVLLVKMSDEFVKQYHALKLHDNGILKFFFFLIRHCNRKRA